MSLSEIRLINFLKLCQQRHWFAALGRRHPLHITFTNYAIADRPFLVINSVPCKLVSVKSLGEHVADLRPSVGAMRPLPYDEVTAERWE